MKAEYLHSWIKLGVQSYLVIQYVLKTHSKEVIFRKDYLKHASAYALFQTIYSKTYPWIKSDQLTSGILLNSAIVP
jgi:hypothetical protein